jgi:hypothetical protein
VSEIGFADCCENQLTKLDVEQGGLLSGSTLAVSSAKTSVVKSPRARTGTQLKIGHLEISEG